MTISANLDNGEKFDVVQTEYVKDVNDSSANSDDGDLETQDVNIAKLIRKV
jgi:hypothetical protein